jgi:YHS domain-containing protein
MFKKTARIAALLLLCLFMAPVFTSHAQSAKDAGEKALQPLKHSDVCMVQNRYGTMKMIPVEVDKKMYYGCCAGCVAKLKSNPAVRFAKDPVTGRDIDKSKAFIVGNTDGTVTYFESSETAERFFAQRKSL